MKRAVDASSVPGARATPMVSTTTLAAPFATLADLTHALADADIHADTLVPDEKGTIVCPAALSDLEQKAAPLTVIAGTDDAEIVTTAPLSHGGMGEVMLAEQRSVGRVVAVKRVAKAKKKGGSTVDPSVAAADLVAEGRVAGQLTHPNIVPVHMLGLTAHGDPLIVMKHIDGESWRDILRRGRDLRRDVDILMQVCRALHFAHSRGVIHRDVKPPNVMIGRHGDVYLLDWGIAVGFGDEAPPELPHARDASGVVGTAAYMAPEMVLPQHGIDVRADVYLAGAVLYELITGRAPHAADSPERSLLLAQSSPEPMFYVDAPDELVAICKKAMRREPAERFSTVEELRVALDEFQRHAAARALSDAAEERLQELTECGAADTDTEQRVRSVFTECRFGFEQALASWPESERARRGLDDAIELMARREVTAGHYDAAALLARELHAVPQALADDLAALKRKRDDDAAGVMALARFAREDDRRTARRERALLFVGAAFAWLATMVGLTALDMAGIYSAGPGSFALSLGGISVGFGAGAIFMPRLVATAGSRLMFTLMASCTTALSMLHGTAWYLGVAPAPALAFGHTIMAFTVIALATNDSRVIGGAILSVFIVPGIIVFPSAAILVSGIGTFFALLAIAASTALRDGTGVDAASHEGADRRAL